MIQMKFILFGLTNKHTKTQHFCAMKNTILTIISFLFLCGYNPPGRDNVTIKPRWKKGETKQYVVERIQTRESDEKRVKEILTIDTVRISVVDKTNKGYIVEWMPDKLFLYNFVIDSNDENPKYLYAANKSGEPIELKNWSELKEYYHRHYDRINPIYFDYTSNPEAILESEDSTFSHLFELKCFHWFMGKTLSINDTINDIFFASEQTLGKDSIMLKEQVYARSIEKNSEILTISYQANSNPSQSSSAMASVGIKLLEMLQTNSSIDSTWKNVDKQEVFAEFAKMSQQISLNGIYTFNLQSGWPTEISYSKIVNMEYMGESLLKKDELSIRLID